MLSEKSVLPHRHSLSQQPKEVSHYKTWPTNEISRFFGAANGITFYITETNEDGINNTSLPVSRV